MRVVNSEPKIITCALINFRVLGKLYFLRKDINDVLNNIFCTPPSLLLLLLLFVCLFVSVAYLHCEFTL